MAHVSWRMVASVTKGIKTNRGDDEVRKYQNALSVHMTIQEVEYRNSAVSTTDNSRFGQNVTKKWLVALDWQMKSLAQH